jgi:hypothetical protein
MAKEKINKMLIWIIGLVIVVIPFGIALILRDITNTIDTLSMILIISGGFILAILTTWGLSNVKI